MREARRRPVASVVLLLLAPGSAVLAQDPVGETIHWAYSAYFGTGRYDTANGDSTYVLSGRPRKGLRDAATDEQRRKALEDLLWALLNSREFLFNH